MTTQRHKYEYKVDINADTAAAKVVRMVGSEKCVLEIGAGPGSITRLLKEHGHCRVTAIELDSQAIEKLKPYCESVHRCDLNNPAWISDFSANGRFEVVVAADVLEHLYAPRDVLSGIRNILDDAGYVVISLPHIGHNGVIAGLIQGAFEYREWGLLDKTHIRFFGISDIQKLFDEAGFEIIQAEFVVLSPDRTEFADYWRNTPINLKRSLAKNRFGSVYQVVIKAKLRSADQNNGVTLMSLAVPDPGKIQAGAPLGKKIIAWTKSAVLPHMSLKTRNKLRRFIDSIGWNI